MGKVNLAIGQMLERKEIFADLMNGSLFGGRQILKPGDLEAISSRTGVFCKESDGREWALERYGDIRMRAGHETYALILASEIQSKIDYGMPVRNMLYDALEYAKQIQDTEKRHKAAGDVMDENAYLSGMNKEDRLFPVITTVFYTGSEWTGSRSLHELLEWGTGSAWEDSIREYVPDYRLNLIEAGNIEHPEKFQSCLQQIFSMLKYKKDKRKLQSYMREQEEVLKKMDAVEKRALLILMGEQKRLRRFLEEEKGQEGLPMCEAIDELIEDGRNEGREEGGMLYLISMICKKLAKGKSVSCIAEELEETEALIGQICRIAEESAPVYDAEMIYDKWKQGNPVSV